MAAAHVLGEAFDPVGVVAAGAEVVAVDVPVGALAGTGCLDVGRLLACLPAAGDNEGAGDGRTLRAVDVLRVGETQLAEIFSSECPSLVGDVKLDERLAGGCDVEDLAAAAVLDALLPRS